MEVSDLSRYAAMLAWLLVSVGVTIAASGCSNSSKSSNPGLLEQNGIKNASDLDFVVIQMAEANGSYLITDKAAVSRVYELLNEAKHVSGISKYFRPNMVTLVRKNGSTLSFAFGLYNPALTWEYESQAFVEFVKTELVAGSKYSNKERLPAFSTGRIARVGSSGKPTILPSTRIGKLQADIDVITAAYKPYSSVTQTSTWDGIANFCTSESPGIEVVLKKPIQFQTLIGWTGPEPPHGSTALNLVALTVDRLVICWGGENRDLWIAFHSKAGNPGWYIADRFEQNELQGRMGSSIYEELISKTR